MSTERNGAAHFWMWPFGRKKEQDEGPVRVSDVNAWLRAQEAEDRKKQAAERRKGGKARREELYWAKLGRRRPRIRRPEPEQWPWERYGGALATTDGIHFSVAAGDRSFAYRRGPNTDWETIEVGVFGPPPPLEPHGRAVWYDDRWWQSRELGGPPVPELADYYDPHESSAYRGRWIYIHQHVPVDVFDRWIAAHGGAREVPYPPREEEEPDVHRLSIYRNPNYEKLKRRLMR